jgi:hypothetical protein
MKNKLAAVLVGSLGMMWAGSALAQVAFTPFVTGTGGSPIGFAYAGNKFVGSNYFNNQLYQTDLTGGNVQAFGAAIPFTAGTGEIYVSSSLGLGGFGLRDVFAGSQFEGNVYRFSNDGSTQSLFASGLVGGVRGIAFDPFGGYGNNMLVTTSVGNVYTVNSTGASTLLANVGGDAEGLDFAPQQFGNISSGTLVVVSEGTGRLNAITSGGAMTDLGLQFNAPEMLSFVPTNLGLSGNPLEGFYAANYATNVIKAGVSQFSSLLGDAVITEETSHQMYRISWNGTTSSFDKTWIGAFPNQPEDGIFVTSAILNPGSVVPEPETYAMLLAGLGLLGFTARRRKQSLG